MKIGVIGLSLLRECYVRDFKKNNHFSRKSIFTTKKGEKFYKSNIICLRPRNIN